LLDNDIITKNEAYYWLSGIFSVFLDNAPTYLVFFSSVGVPPEVLSGPMSKTLVAISTSSVYFGALSYIGNSPNYMVKSVLTQYNVKMPGFFTYMLIAGIILLPIFAVVSKVFI
jgi:Na+/H+ antiporter NhaD/arsenite permease-like protein